MTVDPNFLDQIDRLPQVEVTQYEEELMAYGRRYSLSFVLDQQDTFQTSGLLVQNTPSLFCINAINERAIRALHCSFPDIEKKRTPVGSISSDGFCYKTSSIVKSHQSVDSLLKLFDDLGAIKKYIYSLPESPLNITASKNDASTQTYFFTGSLEDESTVSLSNLCQNLTIKR